MDTSNYISKLFKFIVHEFDNPDNDGYYKFQNFSSL